MLSFEVLCLGVFWELCPDFLLECPLLLDLMLFLLCWLDLELTLLLDLDLWLARLGMLVMVDPFVCSDVTVSTEGCFLLCGFYFAL